MGEILTCIYAFFFVVIFFGLCIFVHELGHFIAAKWRGLHIVAFSIGFKKIWGFKRGGIEYRIGCIPFGGYVDLPQLDSHGVPQTEDGKVLPSAKPVDRILTAAAGPIFNLIFGFILATFLWLYGIPQDTPKMCSIVVASIDEESPEFKAGLRPGDEIVEINGESFYTTWIEFIHKIIFTVGNVNLQVKRGNEMFALSYKPAENPKIMPEEKLAIPFFKPKIPVLIGKPVSGMPAEKAGLKLNDEIVEIDSKKIENYDDFLNTVHNSGGKPLDILVKRNGEMSLFKGIETVFDKRAGAYFIGVSLVFYNHPTPYRQFMFVIDMTYRTLRGIFSRESSIKARHMSGPVGITQRIWLIVYHGAVIQALNFIVMITFSLALLNIMPIPVLDGGHIVLALIERFLGKPPPEWLVKPVFAVFVFLLISLAVFVTFFDIKRLLPGNKPVSPLKKSVSESVTVGQEK